MNLFRYTLDYLRYNRREFLLHPLMNEHLFLFFYLILPEYGGDDMGLYQLYKVVLDAPVYQRRLYV